MVAELLAGFVLAMALLAGGAAHVGNALTEGYTAACEGLSGTYQQNPATGLWECVDITRPRPR